MNTPDLLKMYQVCVYCKILRLNMKDIMIRYSMKSRKIFQCFCRVIETRVAVNFIRREEIWLKKIWKNLFKRMRKDDVFYVILSRYQMQILAVHFHFFIFSWLLNTKASISELKDWNMHFITSTRWRRNVMLLSTRNAVETADELNVFTLFRISRQTFTTVWPFINSIETKRNSRKCFQKLFSL